MDISFEALGIHKSYSQGPDKLHVLKGVDLRVKSGEVVSIVGPSGAGKSTLLHIIGGLDQPNDGQVLLQGEDVYALNDNKRARLRNKQVGFVFQFYHLLPELTALENVILPLCIYAGSIKKKEYNEKAVNLLEQVGLTDRIKHKPNELSGGEQQRVAIARALINEPQILLCDEPTGNLDSQTGQCVIDILMDLSRKNNQTLVIVTHDENIAKLSHRSVKMRDGLLEL